MLGFSEISYAGFSSLGNPCATRLCRVVGTCVWYGFTHVSCDLMGCNCVVPLQVADVWLGIFLFYSEIWPCSSLSHVWLIIHYIIIGRLVVVQLGTTDLTLPNLWEKFFNFFRPLL